MIQTLNSARPSILTGVGLTGAGMARARTPMLTVLALGIAVLLIWAASASTASADQHPEGQGGPDADLQQCVIDTLGFFPSALTDLTPEQTKSIGQNCARPGERSGGPGQGQQGPEIDDATRECVIAVNLRPCSSLEFGAGQPNIAQ